MNAADLHDCIENELKENKSIAALIYLVNHGREVEFRLHDNTLGFISCSKSLKYVSLWYDGKEQAFESIELLLTESKIKGNDFISRWNEIFISYIF